MSNRTPSLLALLGLAAAAGYQNRDKLKGMVDRALNAGQDTAAAMSDDQTGQPRHAEAGFGNTLQAGLSELVHRFTQSGDSATATSWVSTGQNLAVTPDQLRTVLGDGVISELTQKTGLTQVKLLSRLAQVLAGTVDQMTPNGVIAVPEPQRVVM
jgi:uncharacterized protein YidB (DUF937 family)